MNFNHELSQSLLSLVANCINASSHLDSLTAIIAELNSIIPFHSAAIVIDRELNFVLKDPQQLINYKIDEKWEELYFKRHLYKDDPILDAVDKTSSAVSWREVYAKTPQEVLEFKNVSKKYVGDNGLSILKKTEHGSTLISLVMPNNTEVTQWTSVLEYALPHIHEIFNRNGEYQRKKLWRPQLTERELDVLNWVKEGKSNWDISQLLSISERTVKFHLSNIYEKLTVLNRPQSIAKAIHFGLIST